MNVLPQEILSRLRETLEAGTGVRACARNLGIDRGTVAKYRREWFEEHRRKWIDAQLQKAYDLMWEHDCEGCDKITATLPDQEVRNMLDAWFDDQFDDHKPRSKWY